jgi:GNAT superfamily N-acetyltransferase
MDIVTVRPATTADLDDVATTLDLAFRDDPISSWLIPDPEDRARLHRNFMRLFAESALETGAVDIAGDAYGAAVWFRVDPNEHSDDEAFLERLAAACGPYEGRLRELMPTMQAHHPTTEPHLYLNFLAVRPDWQNRGIGAALLRHQFRQLDPIGRPAYLESSSPRSVRLYEREGFERIGGYALPHGGPEVVPMWRKPR